MKYTNLKLNPHHILTFEIMYPTPEFLKRELLYKVSIAKGGLQAFK